MRVRTIYQCEICSTEFDNSKECARCEVQPIIHLTWIDIGLAKGFYGFGETGVKFFEPGQVKIAGHSQDHHILLDGVYGLSHNHNSEPVHPNVLHPYHGWDFLRYVPDYDLSLEMALWEKACLHYEIEPDLSKCEWMQGRSPDFVEEAEQKRAQAGLGWLESL